MFKKYTLLLMLCILPIKAFAAMSCIASGGGRGDGGFNEYIGFGNVVIPPDAKVGDVLASTVSQQSMNLACVSNSGGDQIDFRWVADNISTPNNNTSGPVHNSGIPGLGIKATKMEDAAVFPVHRYYQKTIRTTVVLDPVRFDLIKTGPISSDAIKSSDFKLYFVFLYEILGRTIPISAWYFNGGGTNIVSSTCKLNTTAINVAMGDLLDSDIPSVGSSGATIPFSIPLTCNSATKVSLNISAGAVGAFNNDTGILNLSQDPSSATGVGIQILKDGNPVVFNSTISAGTINAGSSSIVSLAARYIRTLSSVSAGTANSNATIVVSYN